MSQLRLYNSRWGTRYLHVLSFSSPVTGAIASAQTRTLLHHYPVKALQPELEIETVFRSEAAYEDFQVWVRNVQIDAQSNLYSPGVTLWWPQRSIYNWTGLIKGFRAGGSRGNYTPRAKFTVDLVDSMVSARTTLSSMGSEIEEIWGKNTPGGVLDGSDLSDVILAPPTPVDTTPPSDVPPASPDVIVGPVIPPPTDGGGGGMGGGGGGGGSF